jgi:methyl coenzyme M reductase subunit C
MQVQKSKSFVDFTKVGAERRVLERGARSSEKGTRWEPVAGQVSGQICPDLQEV